jgi:hypothetical protein
MPLSILETLQNADYNMSNNGTTGSTIASKQLHNAVVLLEKGYSIYDEITCLLEKHETVESVPEKND